MATSFLDAICTAPASTSGALTGDSDTYLRLTGAASSDASTTDNAALDLSTGLELVIRCSMDDWTPAAIHRLLGKWTSSGTNRAYQFAVDTTGALLLYLSTDGSTTLTYTSTVVPSFANNEPYWLKVTWRNSDGRVQFFYQGGSSSTEPTNWLQIGANVTGTTSTLKNTGIAVRIGAAGAGDVDASKVYRAIIRSSIDGTKVWDADFSTQTAGVSSFVESANSNTVSIGAGASIVTVPWRIAVEVLIASGGARVGKSKVATARVSSYQWFDITGDCLGMEWTRGKAPTSPGFPTADCGTAVISLANHTNSYSPYKARTYSSGVFNTAILHREFGPRALIRITTFQSTATTSYSTDSDNVTTITRANWYPLFTGLVESWDESIVNGSNVVTCRLAEPVSLLATINTPAVASVGAGENLYARIYRLATAASWQFGITSGNVFYDAQFRSSGGAAYSLQGTTMASNRWAEMKLSGESVYNTPLWSSPDGSIHIGLVGYAVYGTVFTGTLLRLQDTTSVLTSDATNYPAAISTYYAQPLIYANNDDDIINSISATNVGGLEQTAQDNSSIGMYGTHSVKRTDLLGVNDSLAASYTTVSLDYTRFDATWSPLIDQTIKPGKITIEDQQKSQRILELANPVIVDYWGGTAAPQIRTYGKVALMHHVITIGEQGVKWSTDLSVAVIQNAIPT